MELYFGEMKESKDKKLLLKKALECYLGKPIDDISELICYGEQGKPYLKSGEAMFSISHTGEFWFCMFGDADIGLDFEKLRQRNYRKLAKRFFSENEQKLVDNGGEDAFYKIWTGKEARAKQSGEGLYFIKIADFDMVESQGGEVYFKNSFENGTVVDLDFVVQRLKDDGKISKKVGLYGSVFFAKAGEHTDLRKELEIVYLDKDDL